MYDVPGIRTPPFPPFNSRKPAIARRATAGLRLNNFPGTGGRGGNIDLRILTGLPVVAFADSVPEVADRGDTDQVDRAAPETSPGHPGA